MRWSRNPSCRIVASWIVLLVFAAVAPGEEDGWIELAGKDLGFDAWKSPTGRWEIAGGAHPAPKNPRLLEAEPGTGVIVNGPIGRTNNLVSKQRFGPIETQVEFMVPKGSNSGIKFEGLYEVQIADSWGVKSPTASDCGGVYPRAELLPTYHHIDKGYPPRTNASKPPGEWQTLDVVFVPPKFDAQGKKVANARFVKVVLNGQVVQENLEVDSPTGHAWHEKESAEGPILLQADHGPVAFRRVRVRPWRAP
jgi:hypothetical protein